MDGEPFLIPQYIPLLISFDNLYSICYSFIMKLMLEKWIANCHEYCKRFNKKDQWEFYIISSDAYMNGYKAAKEDVLEEIHKLQSIITDEGGYRVVDQMLMTINSLNKDLVLLEIPSNQIGEHYGKQV